jgi:ADP-glucose pyrophosphorylase
MDYRDLLQAHIQSGADVTLSTTPVDRQTASGFGILQSDAKRHIFRFEKKPDHTQWQTRQCGRPKLLRSRWVVVVRKSALIRAGGGKPDLEPVDSPLPCDGSRACDVNAKI